MNTIIKQLRVLLDQLEQGGETNAVKQPLLPHADNPREAMKLTDDGKYFAANWWMEGYAGALAGVRLMDWGNENYAVLGIGGQGAVIPKHFHVLVPNMGQAHVSPADLGWMDATGYDPDQYQDTDSRRAAWIAVGCPTVGPRGRLDVRGDYVVESWRHE